MLVAMTATSWFSTFPPIAPSAYIPLLYRIAFNLRLYNMALLASFKSIYYHFQLYEPSYINY